MNTEEQDRPPMARSGLHVLPPDPGRKWANLIGIFHAGGGWYTATCFGGSKKCKAGECRHVKGIAIKFPSGQIRRCRVDPSAGKGEKT
ncbi:hypothetical protein BH24ACT15_BH24ACT15_29930 [soil metagenome]